MGDRSIYIHPTALVESETIGDDTRIWAFAHVMPNVSIGSGCNVGDHSFIESGVHIGNEVTIKNGVSIWEGVTIRDKVFVGPNVAFTNDLRPRSKVYHAEVIPTEVENGVSIGANATIVAGVRLGSYSMVGAGAVVIRDVKAYEVVVGNPARHAGWVSAGGMKLTFENGAAMDGEVEYRLDNGEVVTK